MQDTKYNTLSDVQRRKRELLSEIRVSEQRVRGLWRKTFYTPPAATTPTERVAKMLTTSVSIVDGAILGWKLYRRFKR